MTVDQIDRQEIGPLREGARHRRATAPVRARSSAVAATGGGAAAPGSGAPGGGRAPGVPRAAYELLADAGRGLGRAIRAGTPGERYAAAHLAALRGAAAVLATRARPRRSAGGSAWDLLPRVAPELTEWAVFFGAGSAKRRAAEAGLSTVVSAREADDMIRQSSAFLDLVEGVLGAA